MSIGPFFSGYECVFDKKAFSNDLEIDELLSFFNECDLFPGQNEIQEAVSAMFKGIVLASFS